MIYLCILVHACSVWCGLVHLLFPVYPVCEYCLVLPWCVIKYYHLSLYPRLRVPVPPSCVHRDTLKWLPVRFRIEYKLLVFVFKSLNGLAPTYLDALVKRHTSARSLRSSDQQLLTIPRARLKLKGDRAFSVAAPKLWNLLPVSIRSAQTISSFKLLLKTYLLTQAFNLSECWVLCSLRLFVCVVLCLCLCIFMKMFFCLLLFFVPFWFSIFVQHFGQQWLYYFVL